MRYTARMRWLLVFVLAACGDDGNSAAPDAPLCTRLPERDAECAVWPVGTLLSYACASPLPGGVDDYLACFSSRPDDENGNPTETLYCCEVRNGS